MAMIMPRVAIAGTGGLAYLIAHYLKTETNYPFILIGREVSDPILPVIHC